MCFRSLTLFELKYIHKHTPTELFVPTGISLILLEIKSSPDLKGFIKEETFLPIQHGMQNELSLSQYPWIN